FVANHRCDVQGDTATGETYCIAHHVKGTDDFVMHIRYEDQYVRTPDGWRMKQRDLRLLWTSNEVVNSN
ncbi:MAG TPA: nuclear transport factor 2 family protein, partial [Mycobacteriales bacterium]|nr:nuclear transport factor 2 family protein [Mycobacteriales bacterium]